MPELHGSFEAGAWNAYLHRMVSEGPLLKWDLCTEQETFNVPG